MRQVFRDGIVLDLHDISYPDVVSNWLVIGKKFAFWVKTKNMEIIDTAPCAKKWIGRNLRDAEFWTRFGLESEKQMVKLKEDK